MARPRIIIADTDVNYILSLQLKFVEEFFEKIDLEIITDRNYFENMFESPQRAEVLIVSEDLYDLSIQKHNIGNVFLMTEKNEEEQTADLNVTRIFKYTSIKEIFNEILGKTSDSLNVKNSGKKDPQIVVVTSASGGVGKTTTSINLSACLAEKGKKVLLIDMDSQGNTTSGFGFEKNELDKTVYEVLREEVSIEEAIIPVEECFENLFLIPANRNLAGAEIELVTRENMQYILKKQLEPIKDNYDFIIIDCPPALGMLTVNAMTASDSVLVPIQCEFYALDGLSQLIYTIELIQDSLNPDLYIEGVVFTMYDARTNLSLQVVENVKDNLKQTIYKTIIPRNVRLAEAPSYGLPINLYDKRSSGTEAYRMLADEVIENAQ